MTWLRITGGSCNSIVSTASVIEGGDVYEDVVLG
jgi:hypothetical protein